MFDSLEKSLASHEDRIRKIIDNAVSASQTALVEDLQHKHNALMKENEQLRELYQSEMRAHRASINNLARLFDVLARVTGGNADPPDMSGVLLPEDS